MLRADSAKQYAYTQLFHKNPSILCRPSAFEALMSGTYNQTYKGSVFISASPRRRDKYRPRQQSELNLRGMPIPLISL